MQTPNRKGLKTCSFSLLGDSANHSITVSPSSSDKSLTARLASVTNNVFSVGVRQILWGIKLPALSSHHQPTS